MTLLDRNLAPPTDPPDGDEAQALIKEARRLRRRRWMIGSSITALMLVAGIGGYLIMSAPSSHPGARTRASDRPGSAGTSQARRFTESPDLIQPTTLATLPDGNLLILDSSRDQILELKPDGALSVFAGDGREGFSGDGGPARDAALDFTYFSSAEMAVTQDGSVDFFDGSCRVRQISPSGNIRTILSVPRVKLGSDGTECPLTGLAISPSGDIYLSTSAEVERVSGTDRLVRVAGATTSEIRSASKNNQPTQITASDVILSPDSLAFDNAGNLYIANFSPKTIYRLTPAGKLTDLGASYADQLTTAPNGRVLVGTHGGQIQQAAAKGLRSFDDINATHVTGIHWGGNPGFQEDGIAVTKTGTVYVDNAEGNGYGAGTVLVKISASKHAELDPIRTPLSATLPKVNATGFPQARYPAARRSHGPALTSCPSSSGLERFSAAAIARAKMIAVTYLSSQFASDITVTDRSWWSDDFKAFENGDTLGRHRFTGKTPASEAGAANAIQAACGSGLVDESIAVSVEQSSYSDFVATLYFLDRRGQPLVYYVR